MRKALTIVLAFIYVFTTAGIVINTHYCMGKVAGYALGANDEHNCNVCGMSNEGCCHNDLSILKVNDDHQLYPAGITLPSAAIHPPIGEIVFVYTFPKAEKISYVQGPAPPITYDRLAKFCIYRI